MHYDTSEREAAVLNEALRESEARYRFLAESIPVHIWTALPDGQLDYVSEQTARHLGLTAQQLLAHGWQNVVHPDDLAHAVERWTHALRTGEVYEVEFRLKLAAGNYAFHLARAIPQRDMRGAVVRWFGTNTNVDEQREQQRQKDALFEEIAVQFKESAAAFSALKLEHAKALAQLEHLERPNKAIPQAIDVDWETVALTKLCKILGDEQGKKLMAETLIAAGLATLSSPGDLRKFADVLKPKGGLLGATGSQLHLHAVIHTK